MNGRWESFWDSYEEYEKRCRNCKSEIDDYSSENESVVADAVEALLAFSHEEEVEKAAKEKREEKQTWSTPMTGEWKIEPEDEIFFMGATDSNAP